MNNPEALRLLVHSRMEYALRVKKNMAYSLNHLFDKPLISDPHYIVFERYTPGKHQTAMEQLKNESWYQLVEQSLPPSVCLARIDSEEQL